MKASAALLLGVLRLSAASDGFAQFTFIPTPGVSPAGITTGSDGNVWFTAGNRIGRITPSGTITWFDLPGITDASSIVAGPDGNLWFLGRGIVGVVSVSGVLIRQYSFAGSFFAVPAPIIVGPDGALWLGDTENDSIWRLTPSGVFTEFSVAPARPYTLCSGPDGNLWFGGFPSTRGIRRMTTAGVVTAFVVPQLPTTNVGITSCTAGPDGNVWFATPNTVGTVTPAGVVTQFPVAFPRWYGAMVLGPDGNLWAPGDQTLSCVIPACPPPPEQDGILRVTTAGAQIFYPFPSGRVISEIVKITVGADGALWLTGVNGIVRFDPEGLEQQLENIPTIDLAGQIFLAALIAVAAIVVLRR